jgi:hypothetical protein
MRLDLREEGSTKNIRPALNRSENEQRMRGLDSGRKRTHGKKTQKKILARRAIGELEIGAGVRTES